MQMPLSQGMPLQQSLVWAHDCPYAAQDPGPPSFDPPGDPPHVPEVEPAAMLQLSPSQQSAVVVQVPADGLHVTGLHTRSPELFGRHFPPQQSPSNAHSPLVGTHGRIPASPPTT
jgi:hypothetical protein